MRSTVLAETPSVIHTPDHVALFYRDWGTGQPLVFLSGWALSSEAWAYQMLPMTQQGFRCVAYDRRAHGRSSDPGRGFDFDTLADDLACVLETLDLKGVTLIAHSFASGEAVRYMSRHGRRVNRILLLAPAAVPFLLRTPDNPTGLDQSVADQIRADMTDDFPGWCERGSEAYFVPGTSRRVVDWTISTMTQTSLLAAAELNRIQMNTDFRAELRRLSVPTLIIHGDRDLSAPLEMTAKPAAALIPGAQLKVYEGAPHGIYFTHQHRLNADIAMFAAANAA